jgi:hypothetical protein
VNRTRIVFFTVLFVFLAVLAVSLGARLVSNGSLIQLFIAATIFSAGVVTLDLLGILGHEVGGDGGDGLEFGGAHDGLDGGAGDLAGHDMDLNGGDAAGLDHGGDIAHEGGTAHDGDHGHDGQDSPVLSVLTYLRLLVYFSLGFGPTGWVGMATGRSALLSLLLASAMGVLALALAQVFFRFQRSDTDSSLRPDDLLMAQATVIVPLSHETMGKVRVQVGMSVTEQYALAARPGVQFMKGDVVQISRVSDECVYVI